MIDPIVIAPYDAEWATQFQHHAGMIRHALGDLALRVDHIGSTAVVGLAAKPVIDIQISVADFEPFERIRQPLEACGYRWRADNPDLTKRYFRETPPMPRTHIHVRRLGSWSEQFALLFRDYLRTHPAACEQYAAEKYRLAQVYADQREAYTDSKIPIIWQTILAASEWSQIVGWQPSPSDG
ncbi:MAG: GrpB family protein [Herpetosiphon sp.]|nr:GrpB family protein [Herpetosiphon sp.]